jgi:iron complex outermembrane recepter protein
MKIGQLLALGVISPFTLCTIAQAAEPTNTPEYSSSSTAANEQLEEVVVTAQKREERLQNVPISISVLSGKDLDRSTSQGVSEALQSVPGVATQQSYVGEGGTFISIRGVAPAWLFLSGSSPVAYYLDSVPFGLVKSAIGPDSDVYDLQQVEVLRGPQSTLYGANALNGVVRVLTHDPDLSSFDFKARVSDSGTQYGGDNYRGDLTVNVPIIPDKLAARATIGYEDDDGWIDQPDKKNANDNTIQTYRLKVKATPTDELSIGLSAWRSRDDSGAPSTGYTFDNNASTLDQSGSTVYDAYGMTLGYNFTTFALDSATSYLDYLNEGTLGLDVTPFDVPGGTFFNGVRSNIFSEELNLHSLQDHDWRWSAGAMYRRGTEGNVESYAVLPIPAIHYYDISRSYAIYGELTRLLADGRFELTAGIRHFHDDVSQEDQNAPGTAPIPAGSTAEANTPRAVVTWHVTDLQTVYASYSEGFRSGFPQDANIPKTFASAAPDSLRNYELGSKGTLLDGLMSYDASLYYMDWRGIQQTIGVQLYVSGTYYPAVVNAGTASGVGSDLSVSLHPTQSLTLTGSVSWNDLGFNSNIISSGEILFQKGDRPSFSPETTAGLSADYTFPVGSQGYTGRAGASANYTSSQTYRGLVGTGVLVQSGDPMVFSRASIAIESPTHWTVTLFGDNLNNERGTPVEAFIGTPNWDARVRPRTCGVQFEYRLR